MLGDDAEFFTTNDPKQATIEDGDDNDLLGGDDFGAPQTSTTADELDDFESSFPAVSTQNDVSTHVSLPVSYTLTNTTNSHLFPSRFTKIPFHN